MVYLSLSQSFLVCIEADCKLTTHFFSLSSPLSTSAFSLLTVYYYTCYDSAFDGAARAASVDQRAEIPWQVRERISRPCCSLVEAIIITKDGYGWLNIQIIRICIR